jgi:BRCA1-associated protein
VCGFVGCGRRHRAHIHAHYERHLHAYAMNTADRRVWDFAGDGWVHRLILQQADGAPGGVAFAPSASSAVPSASASLSASAGGGGADDDHGSNGAGVNVKMVEVSDPRHRHPSRPHVAPLSAQEEEEIVSRKLESAARHYNQLVAWQLQHNREQHDIRLQRLRAFIQQETSVVAGGGGSSSSAHHHGADVGRGTNWTTALLQLAATEKAKLLRQTDAARARLAAVREETAVLRELNGSLQDNTAEWQRRADAAQARVTEAQAMHRRFVQKLEERVASLMEKLDTAGTAQAPPSSSLPSLMK